MARTSHLLLGGGYLPRRFPAAILVRHRTRDINPPHVVFQSDPLNRCRRENREGGTEEVACQCHVNRDPFTSPSSPTALSGPTSLASRCALGPEHLFLHSYPLENIYRGLVIYKVCRQNGFIFVKFNTRRTNEFWLTAVLRFPHLFA